MPTLGCVLTENDKLEIGLSALKLIEHDCSSHFENAMQSQQKHCFKSNQSSGNELLYQQKMDQTKSSHTFENEKSYLRKIQK